MEQMKAVVKLADGKENWTYCEVKRPTPKPNEVEIKVKCIGICGSELHFFHDNHFYKPPVVVGHEFCGEISRVGSQVADWNIGDRVVAQVDKGACGKCEFCRKGMPNFCPYGQAVGYEEDGGWADYYCTPENMLFKLPDNISYEEGTMAEPCNVVCQALIVKNTVKPGDVVLVQGCGTIGMLNAMVAKAIGAKTVILTGTDADVAVRLPIAKKIEAIDHVVNVSRQNLSEFMMEITAGKGAEVIVEASGAEKAISTMISVLKKTGTIVVLGEAAAKTVAWDWNAALFKACNIVYSFGEVYAAWDMAIKLMGTGKLELDKLITHKFHLSQYKEAFALLESKQGLKVLLYPEDMEKE